MAELRTLLESLRRGEMPALDVNEVDTLVGWLLGKGDEVAELPRPEHDPVLQQMVFYRLDATIFSGGELRLTAAGLGHEEPADLRKTRFRRLAGAFHPDRHPDLADWLTERSQAVLRAYGRFKHGDEPMAPIVPPASPYPGYPPPRPPRRGPFRSTRVRMRAVAEGLRRRFGNDRFLPHKLIGGLALLAMLPVLNLLLVPEPGRVDEAAIEDELTQRSPVVRNEVDRSNAAEDELARTEGVAGEADEADLVGSESASGALTDDGSADGAASYSGGEVNADSALLAAAREAMRLDESEYAYLPSVDQQLEAMGLDTDTERLYRRIRGESRQQPRATPAGAPNRPSTRQSTSQSTTQSASTRAAATTVPALAMSDSAERTVEPTAPIETPSPTETAPAQPPEPGASDRAAQTTQPTPAVAIDAERPLDASADSVAEAELEPKAPSTSTLPELADSELTLGLLSTHPAGTVLRGYLADIETGALISLLGRFDRQARHGAVRGIDDIARHYQALFDRTAPRRTVLKVVRVERDGSRWRVETEFRIEGLQGERIVSAQDGRAAFTLAGDPLRIQQLEF